MLRRKRWVSSDNIIDTDVSKDDLEPIKVNNNIKTAEEYKNLRNDIIESVKKLNDEDFEKIYRDIFWKIKKDKKLCDAPPLSCPRYDDPICDDMDEDEEDNSDWKELSNTEKKDALDYDLDEYWNEYYKSCIPDYYIYKILSIFLLFSNLYLMFYIDHINNDKNL